MILFKPSGTLDISTDPSALPEDRDQYNLISGAMTRCKNLRIDQAGKVVTRDGSTKINSVAMASGAENLITNGLQWSGATGATQPLGWSVTNAAIFTIIDGALKIERNASDNLPWIYQEVGVVVNRSYKLEYSFKHGTSNSGGAIIVGTTPTGTDIHYTILTDAEWTVHTDVFTATTSPIYVSLYVTGVAEGQYDFFDDVSLRLISEGASFDFIIEEGGDRYVFAGEYIYKNEDLIISGQRVDTPVFSPAEGEQASSPTDVTITCALAGTTIYYTVDGSTPSESSLLYPTSGISVPAFTQVKAIAVRSGWVDSYVASAYYSVADGAFITETGSDNLISETDSDQFITEGD